jgi:hypothetical protein
MKKDTKSEDTGRDRPVNIATMDAPQEEFVAPDSSHAEKEPTGEVDVRQTPSAVPERHP